MSPCKILVSSLMILLYVVPCCVINLVWAEEAYDYYSELLRKALVEQVLDRAGHVRLLWPNVGWYPPGPQFQPISGLCEEGAIPFLIQVLRDGPSWSDEELPAGKGDFYRYLGRCSAALSLGSSRDSRAFVPLLAVLMDNNIRPFINPYNPKDLYDLRAYTAYALGLLGDQKAVSYLEEALRKQGHMECIYALARLRAVQAVPTIISVALERYLFDNMGLALEINQCLEYILRVDFELKWDKNIYWVEEFPEVRGPAGSPWIYQALWQHWLKAGHRDAKEQFDRYYPQWKAALEKGLETQSVYLEKMTGGGVAALPFMIEEIQKGDANLVPVVAELTKGVGTDLRSTATRAECLNWWKANSQHWLIKFESKGDEGKEKTQGQPDPN